MFDYRQLPKTKQYYDNYNRIDWDDGEKTNKETEREETSSVDHQPGVFNHFLDGF